MLQPKTDEVSTAYDVDYHDRPEMGGRMDATAPASVPVEARFTMRCS